MLGPPVFTVRDCYMIPASIGNWLIGLYCLILSVPFPVLILACGALSGHDVSTEPRCLARRPGEETER